MPLCGWSSKKKVKGCCATVVADDRNTEGGRTNRKEFSYIGFRKQQQSTTYRVKVKTKEQA